MDFHKQYPSGLRLVAKQLENFYTVSLGVFVDVGCVRETATDNGYSHFIEHLVFKGTEKRSCLQISEEIDDIGANINAYTSKDSTCFYTKSAAADLEKCMDVLADMYFNATIPEDELNREKGVVIEEIKMCRDTPDDVIQDLISAALFNNQTLGQTILGTIDNIRNADRQSILDFKKRNYLPSATVIAVCGNFDENKLDKLVEKYFEQNCNQSGAILSAEPNTEYNATFLHKFKHIEQSHLQLAWGGCSLKSPDRCANNILASVLGGGLSSRLNQVIREQEGLAYSVYAYPSYYSDCGTFEIYAGLSPENNSKVCELIRREIVKLTNDGVTQKEVDRAVIQAINALYMNVESNMTLMRLYGRSMLKLNEIFDVQADVEKYRAVTVRQVNDLARKIFSHKPAAAYVGPKISDYGVISEIKFN